MAKKAEQKPNLDRVVAENRKARRQYEVVETFEAGLVLTGTGAGQLSVGERRALRAWSGAKPLMLSSNRCGSGPVHPSDSDVDLGLVAAGTLSPQKARVLLLLAVIARWTPTRLSTWFSASPG